MGIDGTYKPCNWLKALMWLPEPRVGVKRG